MAITQAYGRTFSPVGTTEYSLLDGATRASQADATGATVQGWADINAVAPGDVFEIRIYEKVLSGGTQRVAAKWIVSAQGTDNALWISPALMLLQGWDWSIKKTAGTDNRSIPFAARKAS